MKQGIRYWRLGTRQGDHGPSLFSAMKDGNYIAIGYGPVDLSDITNNQEGKDLLMKRLRNKYHDDTDQGINKISNVIFRFLFEIKEVDVVVAGDGEIAVGIGTNIGKYYYKNEGQKSWPNRRSIEWHNLNKSLTVPIRGTLREIHQEGIISEIESILHPEPPIGPEISGGIDTIKNLTKLTKLLESRHQMILAGPPGTSKTHMTSQLISKLGDEDGNYDGNADIRKMISQGKYRQFDPLQADFQDVKVIWDIVQFHPSYGYEDFVSGI